MYQYLYIAVKFTLLSIVLGIISMVVGTEYLFTFIEITTCIGGFLGMHIIVTEPSSRFNFFLLSAPVVLLGSSVGILNSYYFIQIFTSSTFDNLLFSSDLKLSDIIEGQIYVNAFCISLFILGIHMQRSKIIDLVYDKAIICLEKDKKISILIASIVFIQLYLISIGDIIFGGTGIGESQHAAHPLLGISPLFALVPFWSGYKFKRTIFSNWYKLRSLLLHTAFLVNLYYFFTNGRRMVFFFFIIFIMGFFTKKSAVLSFNWKNIFLIVAIGIVAIQTSNYYNKFRLLKGYSYVQEKGVVETLRNIDSNEDRNFAEVNLSNVSTRTAYSSLTLGYFVNIKKKYNKILYGKILVNSFLSATPSDWFVSKDDIPIQERLYMQEYPINIQDVSDTIYLESMLDFGLFGIVVYPFIAFVILLILYRYVSIDGMSSFILGSSLSLMSLSMIETGTVAFLTTLRAVIICIFIVKLIQTIRPSNRYFY